MNTFLTTDEALAIARHILAGLGVWLVNHGLASTDQAQTVVGGLAAAGAIGWSLWQKRRQHAAVQAALQATPPAAAA